MSQVMGSPSIILIAEMLIMKLAAANTPINFASTA